MAKKEELKAKRCPFCGAIGVIHNSVIPMARCSEPECTQTDWMNLEDWNKRPIENHLKKIIRKEREEFSEFNKGMNNG